MAIFFVSLCGLQTAAKLCSLQTMAKIAHLQTARSRVIFSPETAQALLQSGDCQQIATVSTLYMLRFPPNPPIMVRWHRHSPEATDVTETVPRRDSIGSGPYLPIWMIHLVPSGVWRLLYRLWSITVQLLVEDVSSHGKKNKEWVMLKACSANISLFVLKVTSTLPSIWHGLDGNWCRGFDWIGNRRLHPPSVEQWGEIRQKCIKNLKTDRSKVSFECHIYSMIYYKKHRRSTQLILTSCNQPSNLPVHHPLQCPSHLQCPPASSLRYLWSCPPCKTS